MKRILLVLMLALIAVPAMGAEKRFKQTGTRNGKPYFEATEQVSEQATVLAVDMKARILTVRHEVGDTLKLECGPEVKNLPQVKVGDLITVSYTEKLEITILAAGTPELTNETMTAQAKPGEKPSASATEHTTYKASIQAIDKAKGSVTLKGHDGRVFDIWPEHRENLDKVQVGEIVVFKYSEAVAVNVKTGAPAKAATPAKKK